MSSNKKSPFLTPVMSSANFHHQSMANYQHRHVQFDHFGQNNYPDRAPRRKSSIYKVVNKRRFSCGNVFKHFFDNTTMHGFRELYYAKSMVWRIVWFLAISLMTGVTCFQLYKTIKSAAEQPTTTTIQTSTEVAEYPPIKVCYFHWIYWINFTASAKLGFEKSSLLYGLSFLSDVISEHEFDVGGAKIKFDKTMKKNNFSKIMQFYSAVSEPTPPGIKTVFLEWNRWYKTVDPRTGRLCYVASNEMIQDGLHRLAKVATDFKNSIQLMFDPNFFIYNPIYVSPLEFEIYMDVYITTLLQRRIPVNLLVNKTQFKVPPVINVDGVRVNLIMPSKETFQSQIKITGTKYNWLDTDKKPCVRDKITPMNEYCDKVCVWRYMRSNLNKKCVNVEEAVLLNMEHHVEDICNHNFTFLLSNNTALGNYMFRLPDKTNEVFNACIAEYCTSHCEQWKFSSTISSLPVPLEFAFLNFPTLLYVEYPSASSILVITEVYSQTWETLVGNLGGIIGLWLGASIMSILQMIYLLCFKQCDERISEEMCCKSRLIVPQNGFIQNANQQLHYSVPVRPFVIYS